MNNINLDISPEHLEIIKTILNKNLTRLTKKKLERPAEVFVFGSRAIGQAKPFSDLDLAINFGHEMSLAIIADLKEDFDNSMLPYPVDIVDLVDVAPDFKEHIFNNCIQLQY